MVNTQQYQGGVVLIASLVMVLIVSGIAVTLMSASSVDMKVVNAAQDYDVASEQALADSERAVFDEKQKAATVSALYFNRGEFNAGGDEFVQLEPAGAQASLRLFHNNDGPQDLDCPPRANPTPGIKCNMLSLRSRVEYGKSNRHNVTVVSGLAQEMASISSQ
ncbi:pilus assembly protein PilX [Pseudoalteromonas sp. Cnat2-41]|uniref:pilus assembly PilX family protein n=1 Tax=Pseudoalteromonas TaxID=53246 RepID=UPI00124527EF|nr:MULTISPECIES: pilus assembly protein PilX [Pseudoalteromonas]MCF2863165.1 pilus assembly protein PilX [Pseudoalteromonas sp. CNAT2-18]MCG7559317.1 pilus assembly protein PilX [Pseudoalteromonas sp. CNAT2-18.1]|tara:strand:- start:1245 stop:1733 length:489 start_codon:yes stop_codon:yes gene_type:complete